MSFDPILPAAILATIAATLLAARLVTLRQVLLTMSGRRWRAVARWCGMTFAVLLVIGAGFRPGIEPAPATTDISAGENLNVFLVVDRSADTGVDDYGDGQPRLAGIRADITALLDTYPRARYAVIGFGSRALLDWPLSDDVWSLRPVIAALSPDAGAGLDGDAGAAANLLRYQMIQSVQQYPRSANVVMYYGSGAAGSQAPQTDLDPPQHSIEGGAVLGYGAPDAIDENRLRRVADQLGVPYVHRDAGRPAAQAVPALDVHGTQSATGATGRRRELYWVLALPAVVLVLAETFVAVREYRQSRIARREVAL